MAFLDLRLLPTLFDQMDGKEIGDRCVDVRRIVDVAREKHRVRIVERQQTIEILFPSEPNAMLAFREIVMVVRLLGADRIRIGEIPGLEGSEHSSRIIRKVDIVSIDIVKAGTRTFVELTTATHAGRQLYVGRNLSTSVEVAATQGLLDVIFCS